jgi:hypothetical protein
MSMLTLCVLMPSLSLPCSAVQNSRGKRLEKRGEVAGYGGGMCGSRRISSVWSGRALLLRTRSGGWVCGAREGGRVGSTKVAMGQVLGGGEMSSGRSTGFVFDFLFAFGRLVGNIGWFSVVNRPPRPLDMPSEIFQLR